MTEPSREGEKQRCVRKRKIIAVLLVLAAVLGAIIYFLPPREPVYAGEPLSYWLKGYDPIEGSEPGRQKADEIMREAGTNAIPTLLRMLREHDSPWKLKLIALAQKQHVVTIRHVESDRRNAQAVSALEALGSEGKVAVPELIEMYEMNADPMSQENIVQIFASIGPPARQAVPLLLRGVTDPDDLVKSEAIFALGRIHTEPKVVVPTLVKLLRDPDLWWGTRYDVIEAFGEFGRDAKETVPALIETLRGNEEYLRPVASEVLQKIDPETANKVMAENQQAVK